MSTCTHEPLATREPMTNHHVAGLLSQVLEVVRTWHERQHGRRELQHWTERDMRDAGVSPGDVRFEAGKPFWQA
ncbi:DUF1127 domain-containing protein [Rhodopseudomonas sp. P2A-2r]|uniref:DUF1127 domain-containing protein n=1 Tax=unclassified Rhodopseudomonas TaxID=2638247 RepID=UPI002234D2E0|nr:DUF1127 domain-containing protein [Rhodopseudomonas sp. P2A-2r]UZE48664.1 DUF1127 domain-containing protein [Rhodopseudomonas sp. P2A-2r]